MSKLQMLAAARKQKAEKAAQEPAQEPAQEGVEHTRAKMKELSVAEPPKGKENVPLAGGFGKRLKTSESTAQGRMPLPPDDLRPELSRHFPEDGLSRQEMPALAESPALKTEEVEGTAPEMAEPSAFAQCLFGSSSPKPKRQVPLFTWPVYAEHQDEIKAAFSKPSPDDVVLAAQAKGSIVGKK